MDQLSRRLSDVPVAEDGKYIYVESSDGRQVKVTKPIMQKMLGLFDALILAYDANEKSDATTLKLDEMERVIKSLIDDPDIDSAIIAKIALLTSRVALLEEQIKHRPETVFMSQEEFDRITSNGSDLTPISHIEHLVVYSEDSGGSESMASYNPATGVLDLGSSSFTPSTGTLSLSGTFDSASGVLTL